MKKVLVTGGPVHAYLDAVKIITNRFKGGLICELAESLSQIGAEVTYLCAPKVGAQLPRTDTGIKVITHNGFSDYHQKVLELAPGMNSVILGAAVANLIPANPLKGKFPSHNYKPGDLIPIDFTIAPRVIDDIKKAAPNTHLFGFKLLSGVSHEELIHAAYDIVIDAHATAVFANDAMHLQQKYAVTKERGVHPLQQHELASWIWEAINDTYYATVLAGETSVTYGDAGRVKALINQYSGRFTAVENGLIFGTVAMRKGFGFLTTGRGKRELASVVYVEQVDHATKQVRVAGTEKASLNAPLLATLFENPAVDRIVHYHEQEPDLPTYPYAPPGTVRDSRRPNITSFNIAEHGCMLLFDRQGRKL